MEQPCILSWASGNVKGTQEHLRTYGLGGAGESSSTPCIESEGKMKHMWRKISINLGGYGTKWTEVGDRVAAFS